MLPLHGASLAFGSKAAADQHGVQRKEFEAAVQCVGNASFPVEMLVARRLDDADIESARGRPAAAALPAEYCFQAVEKVHVLTLPSGPGGGVPGNRCGGGLD